MKFKTIPTRWKTRTSIWKHKVLFFHKKTPAFIKPRNDWSERRGFILCLTRFKCHTLHRATRRPFLVFYYLWFIYVIKRELFWECKKHLVYIWFQKSSKDILWEKSHLSIFVVLLMEKGASHFILWNGLKALLACILRQVLVCLKILVRFMS